MNNKRRSIEGFVGNQPDEPPATQPPRPKRVVDFDIKSGLSIEPSQSTSFTANSSFRSPRRNIIHDDINESLNDINVELDDDPKAPRERHVHAELIPKPHRALKRFFKWLTILIILGVLGVAGFFAYKLLNSSDQVLKGNIFGIFKNQPLKQDSGGRTNVLILGSTDDDPKHPGNNLTDTIIVISLDQTKHNAYMFSIPRDLYVNYNRSCPAGYYGKINAYFSCINNGSTADLEQARMTATRDFIGNIIGLDIQYSVHVNSVVVRDVVDAVGGIDVDIQGSGGAPGILDRNFDWGCNYTCYKVKYTNGVHHLDGEQAMYLAMARGHSAPTYGLGNSNFDRERNQQKIIRGIQDKALTTQTFTNLGTVTKLIDALGNNLRTNFDTTEVKTLVGLAQNIKTNAIVSLNLQDPKHRLFDTPNINGQSVVTPYLGLYDYDDIQAFIKTVYSNPSIKAEAAKIAVYNGSGITGLAQNRAEVLKNLGFDIKTVGNVPDNKEYKTTAIYQLNPEMTGTRDELTSTFDKQISTTKLPFDAPADIDFVIILGGDQTMSNQR